MCSFQSGPLKRKITKKLRTYFQSSPAKKEMKVQNCSFQSVPVKRKITKEIGSYFQSSPEKITESAKLFFSIRTSAARQAVIERATRGETIPSS